MTANNESVEAIEVNIVRLIELHPHKQELLQKLTNHAIDGAFAEIQTQLDNMQLRLDKQSRQINQLISAGTVSLKLGLNLDDRLTQMETQP